MRSVIAVVPRAHWVNGWFLVLFAVPVVRIDNVDHDATWAEAADIPVAAGPHRVAVGIRYRGTSMVLGLQEAWFWVAEGQRLLTEARNGPLNHQPFDVVERDRGPVEGA